MVAKRYVRIVFVSCFLIFIINKFVFRTWVTENLDSELLLAVAYSLPNFIEAIMGVLLVSGILTYLRHEIGGFFSRLNEGGLYLAATFISAVYVFTQELGIHNVGGNNVYDLNDMVASLLGLIVSTGMLYQFGLNVKQH